MEGKCYDGWDQNQKSRMAESMVVAKIEAKVRMELEVVIVVVARIQE